METKSEICIIPFYHCNLKCPFCYNLDKLDSNLSVDFQEILPKVLDDIEKAPYNLVHLNIYGGEIFDDNLPDSCYDELSNFLLTIKEKSQKEIIFKFTTNLIHKHTKRWLTLFENLGEDCVKITISYDLYGRFKDEKCFDIFKQNVEVYKQYIIIASLTNIKQNIEIFLNEPENPYVDYFKYLYENFKIRITDYVPNCINYKSFVPSDVEMFNFGKFLFQNYPKVDYIAKMKKTLAFDLNNEKYNQMRTLTSCSKPVLAAYYPEGYKSNNTCLFCLTGYKYTKINKKQAIIKRNTSLGCLFCKYYRTCYLVCPASFLFMEKKLSTCYLKTLLELIDENAIST